MKKLEKKITVVYEAPTKLDRFFISKYLKKNIPILIIEPFPAYHHKGGIDFFPPHLPAYIKELIQNGRISGLKAEEINGREIYLLSAEKAVAVVEAVYPEYRKKYKEIIQYVSKTLKSSASEDAFKKNLCNRLAEFYSVNMMLHRLEKHLNSGPIVAYPNVNVYSYLFIKKLLLESNQDFFEHPSIQFSTLTYATGCLRDLKQNLISVARLCTQTIASGFMGRPPPYAKKKKKIFLYGITIIASRQLRGNRRGPDFLIDNQKILQQEVVYFPMIRLSKAQKKKMAELPSEISHLPQAGRFFSNFHEWMILFLYALKQKFFFNAEELNVASLTFFNYFKWRKVLEGVGIKHFITHSDFGIGHVGRNIALNQAGVQTWYFTDSIAYEVNFREEKKCGMRHPYWVYLYYDHLVTWHDTLAQYHKEHPGSFKQVHVIGCIWGEHIKEKEQTRKQTAVATLKNFDNLYVLSCFDSTYLNYADGIAFAMHLLRLADECPDIYIIFKEKKDRSYHYILNPVLGPKLLEIYNKMGSNPRITFYSNQADASELISVSDMVVTFPFTSTTFEALSTNKPAIWHDPMGYYKNTLYGKVGGMTTHSYDELKAKVFEFKSMEEGTYQNPFPLNSPLMDPYRDGKAIDRFRDLLTS